MSPADSHPAPDDRIAVGVIRKPHGVRGELSVEPWTPSLERFEELKSVWLVAPDDESIRRMDIESVRYHGERALVKFAGIDSPEEAGHLREWTIEIPASEARALDEDEYFLHDLIGLEVVREGSGEAIGTVKNTVEGGGGILLEVTRTDGRSFDLPFASAICIRIDLEERTLTVDLPEGLDDLDTVPGDESQNSEFRIQNEEPTTHNPQPMTGEAGAQNPDPRTQNQTGGRADPQPATHNPQPAVRMRVDIVTIFPRMFDAFLAEGVIARAMKSGALAINVHDLRDFATGKHRSTDDEAYGGGVGMPIRWRCPPENSCG